MLDVFSLFPKTVFNCASEKDDFQNYYRTRGYGIYKVTYESILAVNGNSNIEYKVFSGFIRYDKSIRDQLYKYLAMYEEVLINNICEKYKYIGKTPIENGSFNCILKNNLIIEDETCYDMEFFYKVRLTLGGLFRLLNMLVSRNNLSKEQKNTLELRNMVMHHKFLLIDLENEITLENLNKRKKYIINLIDSFLQQIPSSYKESLLESIRNLNKKTKSPVKLDL